MITTAADIKLLRNKVATAIETANETLVISDDDHSIAREIIAEIPKVLDDLTNGSLPTSEHIAKVAVTACNDIQFRDFLLGAFIEFEPTAVNTWLEIIGNTVKKDYAYPIVTVLSTYYYRNGEKETATELIQDVLNHKSDYSLAQLLNRVYPIYTPDMIIKMAKQTHPKVKEMIFKGANN